MKHADKIDLLKNIKNEADFRLVLIDLLKKMGFKSVVHSHRYGFPEFGKDIIGCRKHDLEGVEWYAFIVKHGRIIANTKQIEELKDQVSQCFEYDYEGLNGEKIKINKVKIISNETISNGAQIAIRKSPKLNIYSNFEFWPNEKLFEFFDDYYEEFWLPGELIDKEYSKSMIRNIKSDFEIKELSIAKIPEKKIQKLLDLYIKPMLLEIKSVKNPDYKKSIEPKKLSINSILESKGHFIIKGEAGSGKTKLENRMISLLLDTKILSNTKSYPIKLKIQDLRSHKFDVIETLKEEVKRIIPDFEHCINYEIQHFTIFIDSIDNLYRDEINKLINNLKILLDDIKFKIIITARSLEGIEFAEKSNNIRKLELLNFNQKQIEDFIKRYFEDSDRGVKFIEILKESNILSKLPTSPLTITLISLLYEENEYEIPATITDIYDDFVDVLLGKLEIRSRRQLLDIQVKKRIFSFTALEMLLKKEFEFEFSAFKNRLLKFLSPKGIELNSDEDILRIINNSGILFIDEKKRVGFKHSSFLEFFASLEIYHFRRTQNKNLIKYFNDVNWQNTAIFYAGRSKDMPDFILELVDCALDMPTKSRHPNYAHNFSNCIGLI